jgi:hypothetical protein
MILSAWHVFSAAFGMAIIQMGTSVLGLAVLIGLPIFSLLLALFKDGVNAMREHWKKKVGIGLIPLLAIWTIVVTYQMAQLIYNDHIWQKNERKSLVSALESTNDLFKDTAIEWDGSGNPTFMMTALRSGEDLHVYLDIRQGGGGILDSPLFEGQLAKQPRVEIGTVSHFVRDQILKVTLATVAKVPGNQMVFQWGDKAYNNYSVGVNYSGYLGRIVVTEKNNPKEYHSYFIVVGRSFHDEKSNSTVVGPAFIIAPNILGIVKNWDAA